MWLNQLENRVRKLIGSDQMRHRRRHLHINKSSGRRDVSREIQSSETPDRRPAYIIPRVRLATAATIRSTADQERRPRRRQFANKITT